MGPPVILIWSLLSAPAASPSIDVAALWEKRCQTCHGADGRARTRVGQRESIDDLTSPEWQAGSTNEHIRETIREGSRGNSRMKAFKTLLTPEEIEALIAYIR